jgi:ubiquinone/menaquinone biosynthesis C-methylase UbiE
MAGRTGNVCAGSIGAFYDFYIQRPRLARMLGRVAWGIDFSVLYSSMGPIGEVPDGSRIVDVPCGSGVAFRALRPEQDVRYQAADLDPTMLQRAENYARQRSLDQIEFLTADMTKLPFADAEVDLFLCYSGLHMLDEPRLAIEEFARCLKPGGRLIGTTFLMEGTRRARFFFKMGNRRGHYPLPPKREALADWLKAAGLAEATVGPERTFAAFDARKLT